MKYIISNGFINLCVYPRGRWGAHRASYAQLYKQLSHICSGCNNTANCHENWGWCWKFSSSMDTAVMATLVLSIWFYSIQRYLKSTFVIILYIRRFKTSPIKPDTLLPPFKGEYCWNPYGFIKTLLKQLFIDLRSKLGMRKVSSGSFTTAPCITGLCYYVPLEQGGY